MHPMVSPYLIARRASRAPELLLISSKSGEEALPVFFSREAAERFLQPRVPGEEWYVRISSTGEVISLLCGLYATVEWVSPTPLPRHFLTQETSTTLVDREAFVDFLLYGAGN